MRILIPNATGPTNLGDEAMLEVLLDLLKITHPKAEIIIHSSNPSLYKNSPHTHRSTLYYHSVFENPKVFTRIYRTLLVWLMLFLSWAFGWSPNKSKNTNPLVAIIRDYFESDLIVFVGNGYLRSQSSLSQHLNLVMHYIHYLYAYVSGVETIIMPMSFGPFANKIQEWISAKMILLANVVSVREHFSFDALKAYASAAEIVLSTDLAILTPKESLTKKVTKNIVIGVTLRDWFTFERQTLFEEIVFEALEEISKTNSITILPLIQVFGEEYGTVDHQIMDELKRKLSKAGVRCLDSKTVLAVNEAASVYGSLDILLGMRMHSNIIAASQHTPFVAIAYEYKTQGIAQAMGMSEYVVDVETVTKDELITITQKAIDSRKDTKKHLSKKIPIMQQELTEKWSEILTQHTCTVC